MLRETFPRLFAISHTVTTAIEMWVEGQLAPHFRRTFWGAKSPRVARVVGGPEQRAHIRRPRYYIVEVRTLTGMFSTGSLYKEIFRSAPPCDLRDIWKGLIPAKIKTFLGNVWLAIVSQV